MDLYPWQRRDVDDLARKGYVGLLAYEPGAGKTVCAATIIRESGARVTLIIAPKSTFRSAWIPTLAKFGIEGRIIGNANKAQKEAMFDYLIGTSGTYMTTPQMVGRKSTDISDWSGDLCIIDEIHMTVTPKTSTQRRVSGYTPVEARSSLASRFPMRIGLSGTPLRQSFSNAWAVGRFLYPHLYLRGQVSHDNAILWSADRMTYEEIYTSRRDRNGNVVKVKKYLNESQPGRWAAECPSVYIHKRRERCCNDPEHANGFLKTDAPQVVERRVQLTNGQQKAIHEMEDHLMTFLGANPMVADIPLVQAQRIRQLCLGMPSISYDEEDKMLVNWEADCESPFLDETLQILSELPEDEPVLVYVDSRKFAGVTVERLRQAGITAAEYSGHTTKDRDQFFADFGTRYRVLVAVTSAFGTGTDGAQRKCSTEIWLEQPIRLVDRIQVEARTDRLGARGQTQRFYILDETGYAEGRIDDHVQKRLMMNRSMRKVG